MRDDDYDRRKPSHDGARDVARDPARAPGRQQLVESESSEPLGAPMAPGKRTLTDTFDRWTQGIAGTGLDVDIGLELSRHAVHAVDLPTLAGHDAAVRGHPGA